MSRLWFALITTLSVGCSRRSGSDPAPQEDTSPTIAVGANGVTLDGLQVADAPNPSRFERVSKLGGKLSADERAPKDVDKGIRVEIAPETTCVAAASVLTTTAVSTVAELTIASDGATFRAHLFEQTQTQAWGHSQLAGSTRNIHLHFRDGAEASTIEVHLRRELAPFDTVKPDELPTLIESLCPRHKCGGVLQVTCEPGALFKVVAKGLQPLFQSDRADTVTFSPAELVPTGMWATERDPFESEPATAPAVKPAPDVPMVVSAGTFKVLKGEVDEVAAREALELVTPRLRSCYASGLANNPMLEGRVTARLTMGRTGEIANYENGGSDVADSGVLYPGALRAIARANLRGPGVAEVEYVVWFKRE